MIVTPVLFVKILSLRGYSNMLKANKVVLIISKYHCEKP